MTIMTIIITEVSYGYAVLRLYGYADYTVTSVKAKRPYNHITLKPKKMRICSDSILHYLLSFLYRTVQLAA